MRTFPAGQTIPSGIDQPDVQQQGASVTWKLVGVLGLVLGSAALLAVAVSKPEPAMARARVRRRRR